MSTATEDHRRTGQRRNTSTASSPTSRPRRVPPGLNEDIIRLISAKKNEPECLLEWRLKAYRHWLTMKEPPWPNVHYPPDRLPGHRLLLRAEAEARRSTSLDEVDPGAAARPSRSSASRSRSRSCSPGVAVDAVFDSVSVATTFKEQAGRAGHHLLLVLRGGARAPRPGAEVSRLGRAVHRQLLRGAELGGLQRRLVLLHPEGRALPDGAVDLLPHQRREHRPVRADADHRRRGRVRELPRRLHRADARREPAARRGRRAGRARQRARSSTRPCRTGIPATRRARAASTTS